MSILNLGSLGRFSSARTIAENVAEIGGRSRAQWFKASKLGAGAK
jgi:hypothetical protein